MTTTPKTRLKKAGYARYEIAEGPAKGVIIERTSSPTTEPCFRWNIVQIESPAIPREVYMATYMKGFTLRGLVDKITAAMEQHQYGE